VPISELSTFNFAVDREHRMGESRYKVPANPTVNRGNGWAIGLRSFAVIFLLIASWLAALDHALWK
jgi:hypothetical protein